MVPYRSVKIKTKLYGPIQDQSIRPVLDEEGPRKEEVMVEEKEEEEVGRIGRMDEEEEGRKEK